MKMTINIPYLQDRTSETTLFSHVHFLLFVFTCHNIEAEYIKYTNKELINRIKQTKIESGKK